MADRLRPVPAATFVNMTSSDDVTRTTHRSVTGSGSLALDCLRSAWTPTSRTSLTCSTTKTSRTSSWSDTRTAATSSPASPIASPAAPTACSDAATPSDARRATQYPGWRSDREQARREGDGWKIPPNTPPAISRLRSPRGQPLTQPDADQDDDHAGSADAGETTLPRASSSARWTRRP